MSYTYLQEPGEESSADNFSDIEPFVRLRLNLTAEKCSCNGSATEFCRGSRSGTTCGRSTASPGGESSMSSREDFLARISQQPEEAQESTANAPDSGAKWPESLAKYDPDSRSWRTRQCLLLGGLEEYSETFPKWGLMHGGELFRQPTPVLRTCGKGSGFWPTPVASDLSDPKFAGKNGHAGTYLSGAVAQRIWPTPRASDGPKGGNGPNSRDLSLTQAVKTGSASHSRPTATKTATALFADSNTPKSASALAQQWTSTNTPNETESCSPDMLPTPKSRDWKGQTQRGIHGPGDSVAKLDRGDGKPIGGRLNPDWVEWLMKWPIEWTALKPLGTDKYRLWLRSHGGF